MSFQVNEQFCVWQDNGRRSKQRESAPYFDRDTAITCFPKIEFKHATFINGLYLFHIHKTATVYDEPVYVGCAILNPSKDRMLDFHYNTIEKNMEENMI